MIYNPEWKGSISIILISVLVLISAGAVFYIIKYSSPKEYITGISKQPKSLSSKQLPTMLPTQVIDLPKSVESDIDITKIPNDGRLYLALNLPDKSTENRINIFTKVPDNSVVMYSLTRDNDLNIKMEINDVEYNIKVQSGGTEGPCPQEEFGNQCGYKDEEIQTLSRVKINTLRIWKRESEVFLLNPFVITIDNFYIDHIEITKIQPNKIFQEQEVFMWRDILKSINSEKVTGSSPVNSTVE